MRRRALAVFALLAMAALAGCADPVGSLRMESVDDAELADRASHEVDTSDLPAEASEQVRRRGIVRRVIENGSLNVTTPGPPIDAELPYEYRGAYYDLSHEQIDTRSGVKTEIGIDHNATDPAGPVVALADLPAADREKIEPVLGIGPQTYRPGPEVGTHVAYSDHTAADSTLLAHAGGSMVVVHEGEEYALTIEETSEATLDVYRYEATKRAENAASYAEQLQSEYAFSLSGMSNEEASVVEDALDGSYYAESTDDDGFAALVERFRDRDGIRKDEYGGDFLVRYDGRLYWAEMDYGAFVDDS